MKVLSTNQRREQRWFLRRADLEFYLFISPWLIGFAIFELFPITAAFAIGLTRWTITSPPGWVGLANYRQILLHDPRFLHALWNTAYYTVASVPFRVVAAAAVAVLVNRRWLGIAVFRAIFYLPSLISGVAIAILFFWIFHPTYGLINSALLLVGIHGPRWFFSIDWAMPGFILMSLWGIGGNMVILLAGLQGVPQSLREAARIDGAGWWQEVRHVTLPMLSPALFFVILSTTVASFQVFNQFYVLTEGGPADATMVYMLYLYQTAFRDFQMGYASALAWVLFIIVLALTLLQFRAARRWVFYEEDPGRVIR